MCHRMLVWYILFYSGVLEITNLLLWQKKLDQVLDSISKTLSIVSTIDKKGFYYYFCILSIIIYAIIISFKL